MASVNRFFKIDEMGSSYKNEILGGLTTFSSIIYVLVVNPTILSAAGLPFGSVMVATILVTFLSTCLMGLLANYPFAIAPGLGVSAFFTYSIVLKQGIVWQNAMLAAFFVGVFLLFFTLIKLRRKILMSIPSSLFKGIACGIGLFLIFVGFEQIGMIKASHGSIIEMGDFMNIKVLIAFVSFALIIVMLYFKLQYAFIAVILANWILALILGLTTFKGVVALPPSLSQTFMKLNFSFIKEPDFFKILFSLFLIGIFDSTAGLFLLLKQSGREHDIQDQKLMERALLPDSISSTLGPLLGTTTLAVHIESASGISAGAKTGFSSIIVALMFLLCLFFYPLFSSIPNFATTSVLMVLGCHMVMQIKSMKWNDFADVVSFFVTTITMPLTFSIYHGFAFGFISYTILKVITGKYKHIPIVCWVFSALFAVELFVFK
ncbi:MAG: Adenine permease AdeQ [Chlamydiia bacterium]|nr:Adenine permease AdeQ [Chlamydiia bacterium]